MATELLSAREFVAAVSRGPDSPFAIETVHLPELLPFDVLVKISGVGMCHTDLVVAGPAGGVLHPAVLGHEGAGIVEAVGEAVTLIAPGDAVVLSYDSCGHCANCRSGQPYYCADWHDRNSGPGITRSSARLTDSAGQSVFSSFFGQSSFAEYAVTSQNNLVPVPADLPVAKLGPLGCGLLTGAGAVLNAFAMRPGQSIAVFGAGAVGLSAVMAAKVCRAGRVAVVDVQPGRLVTAERLGATQCIDGRTDDVLAQILAEGNVDFALDTTGRADVIATAVTSLTAGGTCGVVAIDDDLRIAPQELVFGRTIRGVLEGTAVPQVLIPQLIQWWRDGIFPFDELIELFPLKDIEQAAEAARSGRVVKPVLVP